MRYWTFGNSAAQIADWICESIVIESQYGPWPNMNVTNERWNPPHEPQADSSDKLRAGWYAMSQAYYPLFTIQMDQVKAKMGQIPIILQCNLVVFAGPYDGSTGDTVELRVYRMVTSDYVHGDMSNRYKNRTALLTWANDAYFPFWGIDIEENPTSVQTWTHQYGVDNTHKADVKAIVQKALRDNTPTRLYLEGYSLTGDRDINFIWKGGTGKLPLLEFTYIYPIEFYAPDTLGDIDLLAPMDDTIGNEYFLGAVERGETGQAVKGWLKNYSNAEAQIDIWDDYPEATLPFLSAGAGTGGLDYAEPGELATSQKYTVVFYSGSQFEVKAEAYRDNPLSYHPQINGDVTWRGDIYTDFHSPEGEIKIPVEAWQRGTVTADEFVFNVKGNTTDSDWPLDSNEQVEMTYDIAGNPDNSNWRPITARRTQSTLTVTIDAAEKFFPVRYCDPGDWPVGNKAFVMNASTIDEGIVKDAQQPSLSTPAFTGTGLDDMTIDAPSNYNGNLRTQYVVRIDGTGTPDTFEWSRDGGSSWSQSLINITGSPQEIEAGIWIEFAATTGHTVGDEWAIDAEPFGITIEGLAITSNGYGAGSLVATSLPFRDVEASVYSTVSEPSGPSYVPTSRLRVEDAALFSEGDQILIQVSGETPVGIDHEFAEIAAGGVNTSLNFLDLTAPLQRDYGLGDLVTVTVGGERAFWMRPVATLTTVEELKKFRLNAKFL